MLNKFRPLRVAVIAVLCTWAVLAATGSGRALVQLQITGGNIQPLPIAIPDFIAGGPEAQLGNEIAGVITADLKRSGLFLPVDPATFIERPTNTESVPKFGDWRTVNAQALCRFRTDCCDFYFAEIAGVRAER